jgi:hypothetical protein
MSRCSLKIRTSEVDTGIKRGRSEGGYNEGILYERQIKEINKKTGGNARIGERRKLTL